MTKPQFATVEAVEYLGDREVVPITNTEQTFFANGLASHNTFKSYLMLHTAKSAIAQATAAGRRNAIAVIVDTERAYDPAWAKRIGVPLDQLLILHEQTGEDMVNTLVTLLQDEELSVEFIGWDSLAATMTREMTAKAAGEEKRVGTTARFAHDMYRRLGPLVHQADCAFLVLNQTYDKITGYGGQAQAGGRAVEYYPSQRFKVERLMGDKVDREIWRGGKKTKVRIGDVEDFMISVDKDRTQYRPDPVGFSWLVREARIDELEFALNFSLTRGIVKEAGNRWQWTSPDGTTIDTAQQFWRFHRALQEAEPKVQQDFMEAVLMHNKALVLS